MTRVYLGSLWLYCSACYSKRCFEFTANTNNLPLTLREVRAVHPNNPVPVIGGGLCPRPELPLPRSLVAALRHRLLGQGRRIG